MKARLPTPSWAHEYQREWLRGDLLAGVTVTAYLVPQVMAYAELAGLPAATGLWAAVGGLFGYFLFGSSRQLSVGPESTTALMTAAALGFESRPRPRIRRRTPRVWRSSWRSSAWSVGWRTSTFSRSCCLGRCWWDT